MVGRPTLVRRLLLGPSCMGEVAVRSDASGYARERLVGSRGLWSSAGATASRDEHFHVVREEWRLARYAMPLEGPPREETTREFLSRVELNRAAEQWVRSGHAEVREVLGEDGEVRRWAVVGVLVPR